MKHESFSSIVITKAEYDAACQGNLAWCRLCLKFVSLTACGIPCWARDTPCPQCGQSPVYTAEYALNAGYIALYGG